MRIQYCSDLHLEFTENREFIKNNPIKPNADILLLVGDIIPFSIISNYDWFFDYVSDNFKYTYWIAGNHEYYGYDAAKKCGTFNEKIRDNVFLLNNTTIVHEDVRITRLSLLVQFYRLF
jgi:predicted phosphohydrolase